jgi:hypothetical protein
MLQKYELTLENADSNNKFVIKADEFVKNIVDKSTEKVV